MNRVLPAPATLDDLYGIEGKAELIGGRIVHFIASGMTPSEAAAEIYVSLRIHSQRTGVGRAFTDGTGFAIDPPLVGGRQSFSPDAAFHAGDLPINRMRFIPAAPTFAVEVRSENDYGPAAERDMAAKRADYFEAGTVVVWDVDPVARVVTSYRGNPDAPAVTFRAGEVAEAEPAVVGWRMAVDEIFG